MSTPASIPFMFGRKVQILDFNTRVMVLTNFLLDDGKRYRMFDDVADAVAFRRELQTPRVPYTRHEEPNEDF